jgi:hypothetical protein
VSLYVLTGEVASSDVEAARAIGSEVRDLLAAMEDGIRKADPEAIRKAANEARALGAMLADDAGAKVSEAIATARAAARTITRRVITGAEDAAAVVAEIETASIARARFAFMEIDGERPQAAPEAAPAAALDMGPTVDVDMPAAAAVAYDPEV